MVSKKENHETIQRYNGIVFGNYLFLLNNFCVQNLNKVLKLFIIFTDFGRIFRFIHRQSTYPV